MGLLDDIVKAAIPVAAGAFLGPAAGGLGGIFSNPAISGALVSGGLGLLTGQKPKDALKSALLGGIGGYGSQAFGAAANPAVPGGAPTGLMPFQKGITPPAANTAASNVAQNIVSGGGSTVAPTAKTMSGELLKGIGLAGDTEEGNLLFRILNTNLGEGVAAGLIAQALAGDEDEAESITQSRPYGAGGPGGKLGGINYAQGGAVQYFNQGGGLPLPTELPESRNAARTEYIKRMFARQDAARDQRMRDLEYQQNIREIDRQAAIDERKRLADADRRDRLLNQKFENLMQYGLSVTNQDLPEAIDRRDRLRGRLTPPDQGLQDESPLAIDRSGAIEKMLRRGASNIRNVIGMENGGIMQNYPANPPRRDGPINTYEGSGTKDDVPALLTAGEFVMTRDAVKGAGGGNVNTGLNRMYNMMDKFEAMA
tara:strand:+ start:1550 stop:2827 length:1278 start_codon:yes stop_codon:yes gene_type:complete